MLKSAETPGSGQLTSTPTVELVNWRHMSVVFQCKGAESELVANLEQLRKSDGQSRRHLYCLRCAKGAENPRLCSKLSKSNVM